MFEWVVMGAAALWVGWHGGRASCLAGIVCAAVWWCAIWAVLGIWLPWANSLTLAPWTEGAGSAWMQWTWMALVTAAAFPAGWQYTLFWSRAAATWAFELQYEFAERGDERRALLMGAVFAQLILGELDVLATRGRRRPLDDVHLKILRDALERTAGPVKAEEARWVAALWRERWGPRIARSVQ